MKKVLAMALLSVFLVSNLFGCGKSPESAPKPQETEKKASEKEIKKENITLTYMAVSDWVQSAEKEVAKKFEQETGIKIDFQLAPSEEYEKLLKSKLNAGEATDLFMVQSGKSVIDSLWQVEKNATDLTDQEWVKRMDPLVLEQVTVKGKTYGLTTADVSNIWAICYNKKIFEKLGLKAPKSYAEFKDICKKISDSGVTPIYEPLSDGWHQVLWFLELGGRYEELHPGMAEKLNTNKEKIENVKAMEDCLTQLGELTKAGYFGKDYVSNKFADTEKNMASGKYAMTVYNQGLPAQIEKAFPESKASDFGFFVMPLVDNQVLNQNPAGPSLFVYSKSKNQEAAKKYLSYLAKTENLNNLIENTPKYSTLPYKGVKDKFTAEMKMFYDSYPKHATVWQTEINHLGPQWMEIGKDIASIMAGTEKPLEALKGMDKKRADAAVAASDPNWKK